MQRRQHEKMYTCRFCGLSSNNLEDFEEDFQNKRGFWCPDCDGFTYYDHIENRHFFKLIYEEKDTGETAARGTSNIRTNISPLRYPGGKSRIVSLIYDRCTSDNSKTFIEPYCGGASVGLSLLAAGIVKELYLNDIDYGVYSLFLTILENPEYLITRIKNTVPDKEQYFEFRNHVNNGYNCDTEEAAWMYLVVNRMAFSGITKANPMGDVLARWNAKTLINKIRKIYSLRNQIYLSCTDAIELIQEAYWKPETTIFIDPPYFKKGKALYNHWYTKEDHIKLSTILEEYYTGCPGADIILTYDFEEFIDKLYDTPEKEVISRKYCIAN